MATGNTPSGVTSRQAVFDAMDEFRRLGRDAFIEAYSAPDARFRRSREFFVLQDGVAYDSKPLVAAAYGHQHGRRKALHSDDFSGGPAVQAAMDRLDFKLVRWTSPRLELGKVYTRADLRAIFDVTDATLNTGVFQPPKQESIWLFVTREKPADRTQYVNDFEGDLLHWQGQTAGRTDRKIIEHAADGRELLVFYRERTRQYPGGGFRYEGPFHYVSRSGAEPTSFVLRRTSEFADQDLPEDSFNPNSIEDGRKKVWAQVKRRQGQPAFRRELLAAYGGRCAVTGCPIEALLEAAHIHPYLGDETNIVQNGLLLRADIHTLFDLGFIAVGADGRLLVSKKLDGTEYVAFKGARLGDASQTHQAPSPKALAWHRQAFGWDG